MLIWERVSRVRSLLDLDISMAISSMSESVLECLEEHAVAEALDSPVFRRALVLAERDELAGLEAHSREAWAETKRAERFHKSPKTSLQRKIQARDDEEHAHMFAALKHDVAGNESEASKHYAQAAKAARARRELDPTEESRGVEQEGVFGRDEFQRQFQLAAMGRKAAKNFGSYNALNVAHVADDPTSIEVARKANLKAADTATDTDQKERHLRLVKGLERLKASMQTARKRSA